MTVEDIRTFCLSLKGVTEDIKWGDHLCFSVGGKMFVVTAPDSVPVTASFKTSDELFEELTDREGIIPAPYMAKNKWVYVDNINRLSSAEWKKLLMIAYELVLQKLSGKMQREITGGGAPPAAGKSKSTKAAKKPAAKKKVK